MEKERLRQLARIGANLNQIAKWANTYKRAVEAVEVLTALASLEEKSARSWWRKNPNWKIRRRAMIMKVFPHGTGEGDKPTRYLVRPDYPGRDTRPPQVLRGDVAVTRALIDSIHRKWKYTAGALSGIPTTRYRRKRKKRSWMPSSRLLSPGWSRISATFFGCVTSMPDITNYTSSFPGWSFPAATISTLVLRAGKKISTCSATSSTTGNNGHALTTRPGSGRTAEKGRPVQSPFGPMGQGNQGE